MRLYRCMTVAGLLVVGWPHVAAGQETQEPRFAADIERFEAADRESPPAPGGIVFVGSSSIRLWSTLAEDFPGLPVINRGFGGSRISDVLRYADRIIIPYRPSRVIVYAGENDLAGGGTHEQVVADYRALVDQLRAALPDVGIAWITMKPSPSRWHLADAMREGNRMIEAFSAEDPLLNYIDVFTPMLGENGRPIPELFVSDSLHMTPAGYAVWRSVVGPFIAHPITLPDGADLLH